MMVYLTNLFAGIYFFFYFFDMAIMQDVIDAHVEREEEYSEMQKNKAECRREDRRKII